MHNIKRMQKSNSHYYLLSNFSRVVLVQIIIVFYKFKEILTIDQLCYDVDVSLGLNALLKLEQEWMRNDLHYAALVSNLITSYAIRFLASRSSLKVAIYFKAYY